MASAARRIKNVSINWAALAERVPPEQKPMFIAFKVKSDGYLKRMLANPEEPPKINWEYYRSRVAVKGMVDDFQKQYTSLSVPYPKDTVTPEIEAQERETAKEIEEFVRESNKRIATYEEEIKRLKSLIPFEQMTMEDFKDAYPHLAIDTLNRPTFWPHTPEEQPGYKDPTPTGGHGGH